MVFIEWYTTYLGILALTVVFIVLCVMVYYRDESELGYMNCDDLFPKTQNDPPNFIDLEGYRITQPSTYYTSTEVSYRKKIGKRQQYIPRYIRNRK